MSMRLNGSFGCTKMGVSSSSHWSDMAVEPGMRPRWRQRLTCGAEVDFEHVAEYRGFIAEIAVEDHKAVFYFFHVVVRFASYLDFECVCNEFIVSILDILMMLVGNGIPLNVFDQSTLGEIKLWIVWMLPDEQGSCCTERVCDASAVDEDSHASLCLERLVRSVLNEVAGKCG